VLVIDGDSVACGKWVAAVAKFRHDACDVLRSKTFRDVRVVDGTPALLGTVGAAVSSTAGWDYDSEQTYSQQYDLMLFISATPSRFGLRLRR
jgi:hypothetical protein